MEDLEKKYKDLINKRKKITDRLNMLHNHLIIKEYNELKATNQDILRMIKEIENQINISKYINCNHVLINTYMDNKYISKGCIKCEMCDDVKYCLLSNTKPNNYFTNEYLKNDDNLNNFISSKTINVCCDLELAHAIYLKIIENHPNIDDDTLIKYFENALNHIRSIEVNDDRKISRAKRLHLSNNFIVLKNKK